MQAMELMPVLIPARDDKRSEGTALVEGKRVPVIMVPEGLMEIAEPSSKVNKRFAGMIDIKERYLLYGLAGLLDAIKHGKITEGKLGRYYAASQELAKDRIRRGLAAGKAMGIAVPEIDVEAWAKLENATVRKQTAVKGVLSTSIERIANIVQDQVRFCIWECNGVPQAGLLAPDLLRAVAVHMLLTLRGSAGVGVCKWPKCAKSFIRTRHNSEYCCPTHGNNHRVAVKRAKRKGKSTTTWFPPIKLDKPLKQKRAKA